MFPRRKVSSLRYIKEQLSLTALVPSERDACRAVPIDLINGWFRMFNTPEIPLWMKNSLWNHTETLIKFHPSVFGPPFRRNSDRFSGRTAFARPVLTRKHMWQLPKWWVEWFLQGPLQTSTYAFRRHAHPQSWRVQTHVFFSWSHFLLPVKSVSNRNQVSHIEIKFRIIIEIKFRILKSSFAMEFKFSQRKSRFRKWNKTIPLQNQNSLCFQKSGTKWYP